jgi:DNA-binding CsgD family transcriptional regulator
METRKLGSIPLGRREREVADALRAGLAPRQIAEQLGISIETVRKHRTNIYRKLKITGIAQLIGTLGPHRAFFFQPC